MMTNASLSLSPDNYSRTHAWKQRRVLIDEAAFFNWVNSQGVMK